MSHYCESFLCEITFKCNSNCICDEDKLVERKGKHEEKCECKCRFVSTSNGDWGFVCSQKCDDFFNKNWSEVWSKCPDKFNSKGEHVSICSDYDGCKKLDCKYAHLPGCSVKTLSKKDKKKIKMSKFKNRVG
jgi:hypothetical protein